MDQIKLGLVGAGNIAGAIVQGIVRSDKLAPGQIGVYDILPAQTERYAQAGHVVFADIPSLVAGCEYVILAVKPQSFTDVLPLVKRGIRPETVIVSIAAGISAEMIQNAVGFACKVVLVMPNTALLLGQGATALARVEPTTPEEFGFVMELFALGGIAEEVPADRMREVIAVNGSSPAFVYHFAQVVCDYAEKHGIPPQTAQRLIAQTLLGSAHMLLDAGKTPQELIDMVCSPGGTTIAGLAAMDEQGFDRAVTAGCEACLQRAVELSEGR